MIQHIAIIVLLLLACASPLLTWLHLWQVKEWRWDRLSEHFRQEGFSRLYSSVRVALLVVWALYPLVTPEVVKTFVQTGVLLRLFGFAGSDQGAALILIPLAGLSLLQIGMRKQPKPKWTMKARLLVVTAAGLNVAVAVFLLLMDGARWNSAALSGLIPYLQPQAAAVAWLLTYPLDRYLKRRIMNRARAIRAARPRLTVIGVTGSVGKTTTKELLAHVLASRKPLVPPDHVNTEMGVSAWIINTLSKLPADSDATVVVEMGAYRMGEIALLCSIVQPNLGAITRIAEQHLALFGSREAIAKGKGELFASLPENGRAFVNIDSPLHEDLVARCRCPVTTVGTGGNADVPGLDIEETSGGVKFTSGGTAYETGLHGTHNVTNVLLAVAVAQHLGLSPQTIAKTLRTFSPPKRTFQVRQERGVTVLDDTYNSSPASMVAAVE